MKYNFPYFKKTSLPNIAIAIVVLACLFFNLLFKNWEKTDRVIEEDVHWYYGYLPALFIYDDIRLEKSDYYFGDNYYLFWTSEAPNGNKVIRTTMGLAVLYAPFFFVADIYSRFSAYPANGFSEPYKMFLLLSAVFYLFIGLDFLKKILFHYRFSELVTASVILLVGLGTNLFCYSSQSGPMPHVYNFFLFSVFIYYTIQWYQLPSIKNSLITGLLTGLISLIRPSNAVLILFFIFYGIAGFTDIKRRFFLYKERWLPVIIIIGAAFLVWLPQLMYWKKITGDYLFYSYGDEYFFWKSPKIAEGLFSFRKGWLVYTPVMGFALLGIFFMKEEVKKLRLPIILFLAVNIYIIFSWWCWWYGGSFGQRSLIESYVLLALPLSSFIQYLYMNGKFLKYLFFLFALFFVLLNGFQTIQYELNSLHWDGMTRELYLKQFGRLNRIEDFEKYVKRPNYMEAMRGNSCEIPINTEMENTAIYKMVSSLKSANGKYLCTDVSLNNRVIANRDSALLWETFTLLIFENNKCAIRTHNDFYLSSDMDKKGEITAARKNIGIWELFDLTEPDSNWVAFKAVNGKYLSLDEKTLQIFARADEIGVKERFEIIP